MKFARIARRIAPAAVSFLMVPSVIALPATAATTSQATAPPIPTTWVKVQPAPQLPAGTTAEGALSASTTLTGAVALARDDAALASFIANVTNKSSADYGQYLAPGTFASEFGPLPSTISAVEQAVQADGLSVTGVSSDGLLVDFSGTATQAETTFGTHLESYHLKAGWTGRGTTEPVQLQLPAGVSGAVTGILGLDDLVQAQSANVEPGATSGSSTFPPATAAAVPSVAGAPTPCTDAQQDAVSSGGLTDDQIANAYGAFGLYKQGDFAQGQHIAVYELQPFLATDIETFDTCYFGATESAQMSGTSGNLAGSRLSVVPVDGGLLQPGPGSENDEATLDVEDVSAMAPEADVDVYEAPNTTFGGIDQYATIIGTDIDQVVTSSWGVCEQLAQQAEPGVQEEENFLFQQAAAQGQTVLSAEGDTGDDSCNEARLFLPPPGQNLLSVLDPATQPYVVSVGGTTIDDATQPPSEHVWNDGADWGAGGGGISETWAMPSWQQKLALTAANATDITNAEAFESENAASEAPFTTTTFCDGTLGLPPGTPCREAPDVSAQADEFTGSVTIFGVSLGYGNPNGWVTIGGTSSATPIWAAMLALVNGSKFCTADTVSFANGKVTDAGFASPILYGIATNATAYAASFNNVTVGDNDLYGLDNGLVFPARTGYNMASGLGSPQLTSSTGGPGLAFYMCQYSANFSPPAVTNLNPTFGPLTGGEVLTVTGAGFENGSGTVDVASVQVGSTTATSFTVVSKTVLNVTLPPAGTTPPGSPNPTQDGAGPAQIIVTLTSGLSSAPGPRSVFDFVDETSHGKIVPTVAAVSPYGGLATSPATVTVLGSGFVSPGSADKVEFGGVAATAVTYVSQFELTVTPPALSALSPASACPVDNGAAGQPLNAADDICQVEVTVTTSAGTSATAAPLAPYEGPFNFDSMGGLVLPSGCNCEEEPQTDEYDYVPVPTITGTSTSVSNPASLASEFGGASTNTVVVTGTGLDPLTFTAALLTSGAPFNQNSVIYPVQESGTSMVLEAPPLLAPGGAPTTQPFALTVGAESIAGISTETGAIDYSGVPVTTGVVNTANANNLSGLYGAVDTGGAPLEINGTGFAQAVGPLIFAETVTGTDSASQYTYNVVSDNEVTALAPAMNPDLVDVFLCSTTGCSPNPPADELLVYPPGDPVVTSVTPSSGPPSGGTPVVISGQNLGCVVSVSFGSIVAESFTNEPALLDCGTTGLVDATSPAGTPATTVAVTVQTAESFFTGATGSTSALFDYTGAPGSPVITSDNSATAQVGVLFSFTVTTAGNPPITLSEAGPLPQGVKIRTSGHGSTPGTALLEGTPSGGSGGIYYFALTATNRAGTASQAFTLTVNQAPNFSPARSTDTVLEGEPATIELVSTGYPTPAVSITAGTLPAGLSASDGTDGVLIISGTPQPGSAASYPLTVSATNKVGTTNEALSIVVNTGP